MMKVVLFKQYIPIVNIGDQHAVHVNMHTHIHTHTHTYIRMHTYTCTHFAVNCKILLSSYANSGKIYKVRNVTENSTMFTHIEEETTEQLKETIRFQCI